MKPLETVQKETGRRLSDVFDTFLTLAACALAHGKREEVYLKAVEPYKPQATLFQQAFGLLVKEMQTKSYTDLLGGVHETFGSKRGKELSGEFYTPQAICRFMARATVSEAPSKHRLTVHEPATGSGRMILALAEHLAETFGIAPTRLWVEAWDVNLAPVYMTYINTTLWGIPCNVVHGNTLSLEVFDVWPNLFSTLYPLPRALAEAGEPEPEPSPEPSGEIEGADVANEEERPTAHQMDSLTFTPLRKPGIKLEQGNLFSLIEEPEKP